MVQIKRKPPVLVMILVLVMSFSFSFVFINTRKRTVAIPTIKSNWEASKATKTNQPPHVQVWFSRNVPRQSFIDCSYIWVRLNTRVNWLAPPYLSPLSEWLSRRVAAVWLPSVFHFVSLGSSQSYKNDPVFAVQVWFSEIPKVEFHCLVTYWDRFNGKNRLERLGVAPVINKCRVRIGFSCTLICALKKGILIIFPRHLLSL